MELFFKFGMQVQKFICGRMNYSKKKIKQSKILITKNYFPPTYLI